VIGWLVFAIFWVADVGFAQLVNFTTPWAMVFGVAWGLVCWYLRQAALEIQRGEG
jgi:hypothetical protein